MSKIVQKKIDISVKIKTAFVKVRTNQISISFTKPIFYMNLQQINEAKSVSVIWRRNKKELESKSGVIDPNTHETKIDDIFKMKTALDFDLDEHKFQPKMSILELVFSETKQAIGHAEFDLGQYTNKMRDSTVKTILDLRSDKFPGCQIYIYVFIQLLDSLPEKATAGTMYQKSGTLLNPRSSIMPSQDDTVATIEEFDPNANAFDKQKKILLSEKQTLEAQQIKYEQENERLQFKLDQANGDQMQDFQKLLQQKYGTKSNIKKKIEKYSKQESIIIKVL